MYIHVGMAAAPVPPARAYRGSPASTGPLPQPRRSSGNSRAIITGGGGGGGGGRRLRDAAPASPVTRALVSRRSREQQQQGSARTRMDAALPHQQQQRGERMQHSTDFLSPAPGQAAVLVVLNFYLPRFTPAIWEQAPRRVCADGGANRLYYELPLLFPAQDPATVRTRYKPDAIIGDLDSVEPEVRAFYKNLGTEVIDQSEDQDTTDLHKCVAYIRDSTPSLEHASLRLLVVGALGGRFDHEVSNINVLYTFAGMRIILLSPDSLLFLLPGGIHHDIHVTPPVESRHCGIIPIGAPASSTTTTGLKWNLDASPIAFGALISTSNRPVSETVTVHSDSHLLWTIEIPEQDKALTQARTSSTQAD